MPGWRLLAFVFAFAETLEDGETSLLGIAYGKGLEFDRRMKSGNDLAHRFFAGGTLGQFRRAKRAAQSELAATRGAVPVAKFVFVEWHIK